MEKTEKKLFEIFFLKKQCCESVSKSGSESGSGSTGSGSTGSTCFCAYWIRIHRIHMFLGLLDPDPDPLVTGMDPDPVPDLSIIKQK
jgi:hypothetical protein